jgi:hypothetical protein
VFWLLTKRVSGKEEEELGMTSQVEVSVTCSAVLLTLGILVDWHSTHENECTSVEGPNVWNKDKKRKEKKENKNKKKTNKTTCPNFFFRF